MKILVISPKNKTVFNFRGDLIRDMIKHGNQVYVTGPNQDFLSEINVLGVSGFFEIPFVKDNTNVWGDMRYMLSLRKIIKVVRPDLVFSYNIKPIIYGSLSAYLCKVPHIFALVAGLGRIYGGAGLKVRMLRKITGYLYTRAFRVCEKVFFQNGHDIDELTSQKFLPREKAVLVNGSGVNMSRFPCCVLPMQPVFLMVSRIIREKGVIEYCEAARLVRKKHPEARFILLGGFDRSFGSIQVEEIQSYIDDRSIEFPGEVKDPVEYYSISSVFVLPSYYREGLPRTILEAMSCGRPVITTDWPGCREPIEDGKNGFLIPIKDFHSLAEKMIFLINNPQCLAYMAKAAHETCRQKYAVDIVNSQMRSVMHY